MFLSGATVWPTLTERIRYRYLMVAWLSRVLSSYQTARPALIAAMEKETHACPNRGDGDPVCSHCQVITESMQESSESGWVELVDAIISIFRKLDGCSCCGLCLSPFAILVT